MTMTLGIRSLAQIVTVAVATSVMAAASLAGVAAQAQQPTPIRERVSSLELTYDYIHTNGPPSNCGCINLNGGGATYVQPMRNSPFSLVGGITASHAGGIGTPGYTLTLVTYTAGARYLPPIKSSLFQPYAEIQLGGAHASGTLASTPSLAGSSIGTAFAATTGGGVNLFPHRRISFKLVDAAYLITNYANGSSDHQNDLRISTGLIISLCRSKTCSTDKH